jgi:hypothetical protein
MENLYKSLYLSVNGWSTNKMLGWMIMDSQLLTYKMWAIKMTLGFLLHQWYQVFYILDPKDEKKHIVVHKKQWVVRVEKVKDEEQYNQFDDVSFFVDTKRISIIEPHISYSNVIPYTHTDGEGKLVHV